MVPAQSQPPILSAAGLVQDSHQPRGRASALLAGMSASSCGPFARRTGLRRGLSAGGAMAASGHYPSHLFAASSCTRCWRGRGVPAVRHGGMQGNGAPPQHALLVPTIVFMATRCEVHPAMASRCRGESAGAAGPDVRYLRRKAAPRSVSDPPGRVADHCWCTARACLVWRPRPLQLDAPAAGRQRGDAALLPGSAAPSGAVRPGPRGQRPGAPSAEALGGSEGHKCKRGAISGLVRAPRVVQAVPASTTVATRMAVAQLRIGGEEDDATR